jgi:hypothetical protein
MARSSVKGDTFAPVPNRGLITISIMLANIMQGVDNTILNVALPHIQGSLSASLDQIAWALTSYIVCAAIMMPLTGWFAGQFGIKYVFLASVIGFTLASALCGAATSLPELVLFRALQGVAGAGLIPLSQATLFQINPPERHGHAMAIFGIGTILGPIMGPALGGWLTYDYSWRWVFYINLPVGVVYQRPWPADKVERWGIERLIPYAKNARVHTDAQGRRDSRQHQGVGLDDGPNSRGSAAPAVPERSILDGWREARRQHFPSVSACARPRARRRRESKTVAGGQGRALGDRAADPVRKKMPGSTRISLA